MLRKNSFHSSGTSVEGLDCVVQLGGGRLQRRSSLEAGERSTVPPNRTRLYHQRAPRSSPPWWTRLQVWQISGTSFSRHDCPCVSQCEKNAFNNLPSLSISLNFLSVRISVDRSSLRRFYFHAAQHHCVTIGSTY